MDEAHHFLLAKDSNSFLELYKNAAYEGHPLLWNGLLFLITRFSSELFYMQLLNISIMAICVYLFVTHAPFKKLFSVLIVFGYFFIYEYNIISRNYAISLLCLTLVFIQLNKSKQNHLLIAISLLLLSYTHIYSILITIPLCVILVFLNKTSNIKYIYTGIIIFNILILYSLKTPADHFLFKIDTDPYLSYKRFSKAYSIYLKGFLPIPDFTVPKVWNTNLIVALSKVFATVLSVVFAFIPFYIFRKEKLILFFFYFSTLAICSFIYLSPLIVAIRYCGFIFVILIFSFWLHKILYPNRSFNSSLHKKIALVVLILHVLSGLLLYITDIGQPFSNSKNVANYLKEKKIQNKNIYLSNLSSGPPISAYLNKKIIYLETEENSSYCKWNSWPFIITKTHLSEKINRLIKDTSVLILNHSYIKNNLNDSVLDVLENYTILDSAQFNYGMVTSEKYSVYYVSKK